VTLSVNMANTAAIQFNASTMTYGKTQYDQSQTNVWAGPAAASLGVTSTAPTVTLPPWSMVVLQLK
jgi:hypothetical protein